MISYKCQQRIHQRCSGMAAEKRGSALIPHECACKCHSNE